MASATEHSRRKQWSRLGRIRNTLLVVSIAGIVPTICVALAGYFAINHLNQKTSAIASATATLRNHWEGDMIHDDLRGDVLGALLAKTDEEKAAQWANVAADASRLRTAVLRNRSIPAFDPEVRVALDSLNPALEAYVREAEVMGNLAEQDRLKATARLPAFEMSFKILDRQQERLSDLVMAKEKAAEFDSVRTTALSKQLLIGFTLVSLAGFCSISWLLSRRLARPLNIGMQTILAKSNIIPMFVSDGQGSILEANDAYLQLLGRSREELTAGRVIWKDMVAPGFLRFAPQLREQLALEGVSATVEMEYIHADGHRVSTLLGLAALDPIEDTAIGFLVDLSERKRVEQKLRESEQRLLALVDSLDDVVVEMDEQGRFLDIWARGESLLPRPKVDMIGQNIATILGDQIAQQYLDKLHAAIQTGQSQEFEYSMKRSKDPEGTLRWVLARIHPTRSGNAGRRTACLVISEITPRKLAEEELRRAKEAAETANVAKSEFLANMSHEIRTPMNGILGTIELVLDTSLNFEQRKCLDMAKTSADSLLAILSDILDLSKVEAGKLALKVNEFRLRDTVQAAVNLLACGARYKNIELACRIDDAVPESLLGDDMRLRQVLLNLIGNAIKFTSCGQIEVQVHLASRVKESVRLHFVVRDTGIGIAADKQELIFEAFAQADGSMTRRFGGTGLGLTISSRLVEMMGGRMWVDSTPGEGSRFHFTAVFDSTEKAVVQIAVRLAVLPPLIGASRI